MFQMFDYVKIKATGARGHIVDWHAPGVGFYVELDEEFVLDDDSNHVQCLGAEALELISHDL